MNRCGHCGKEINADNMVIDEGITFHPFCHSVVREEAHRADKLRRLSEYSIKTYGDLVKFFGRVLPNLQVNDIRPGGEYALYLWLNDKQDCIFTYKGDGFWELKNVKAKMTQKEEGE